MLSSQPENKLGDDKYSYKNAAQTQNHSGAGAEVSDPFNHYTAQEDFEDQYAQVHENEKAGFNYKDMSSYNNAAGNKYDYSAGYGQEAGD